MADWPVHARIDGPIVMIGFGSIGKGTLPLIERHRLLALELKPGALDGARGLIRAAGRIIPQPAIAAAA